MGSMEERRKMLEQALCLIAMTSDALDWDYLRRRAKEENLTEVLARIERMPKPANGSRWEQALRSGKLQILGPRLWKWRIDFGH